MKKNLIWTIIIIIVGGVVLFFSLNKSATPVINTTVQTPTIVTPNNTKTYTISDISIHNTQSSCWTAVNGKVYDITSFISSHPAGVDKIMRGCGIDATNIFNRVGAHSISRLSNTLLGLLK